MKTILFFSLFLSGCTLPFVVDHLPIPTNETVRVRRGDTLRMTSQELVKAKKVKNSGTIIVQAGESNNASAVEKAKAPVAVGEKPTASTIKEYHSFLDYAWILFVGALVLLYFKYKR